MLKLMFLRMMFKLGWVLVSFHREVCVQTCVIALRGQREELAGELRFAESEVEVSRRLLVACAKVRDGLRKELEIVTAERDLALAKLEGVHAS